MTLSVPQKYISIALHVLVWSALLFLPYFVPTVGNDHRIGLIPGKFYTVAGFIHMGIFYGNACYLYPRLCNRRFWWLYIIASFLLLALASMIKSGIGALLFPDMMAHHGAMRFVFGSSMIFYAASIIYRRIIDRARREQLIKTQQAAQLQTELKFLRSQISPHFLFNVLTNLVSLARKKSERLEEALIMLADLMRYMLYDTQGKKVPLQKEIDYLNSYIALQKLRFGTDIVVNTNIEAGAGAHEIEPMLLIPFVENAFKHGTAVIDIRLKVKDQQMVFEVQNQIAEDAVTAKDSSSGIGLNNVQQRLDLLYHKKYKLLVSETDHRFFITLTLHLS